jgi:outer membrane protein OmpA-like peptidoglycan-associated protein
LFASPTNEAGGLVNEFPGVNTTWTGNQLGDLYLGGKLNLLSQARLRPMALAARGTLKLPTADKDKGAGTGAYDGFVDLVGSGEARGVELAGFGGVALRGDPDAINISDGIRWGGGVAFPSRRSLRVTAEVFGEYLFDAAVTAPAGLLTGADGSLSPATSDLDHEVNTALGLTWQHRSGLLLGAALSYRIALEHDDPASGGPPSTSGDALGMQFRLGFHRGVKTYVPPPPAVAVAAPPPAPAAEPVRPPVANRAPTVRAVCNPCTLKTGQSATLRAEAIDPDGDALTFRWSATGGTIADTRAASTTWRADVAPGIMTFTVVVEDGRGGVASDMVTGQVGDDEGLEFEDVHFDFDSYSLRADALLLLEPAIAALRQYPQMRLMIEGHTCSIGTVEYNLALGERRANAVRDYLVGHGIAAARLSMVAYGEEQPGFDNSQESTRRLNRRAVLVVRVTQDNDSAQGPRQLPPSTVAR